MRPDRLLVIVVFVLAVGGIVAYKLLGNGKPDRPDEVAARERGPVIASQPREFLGISLALHSSWDEHPYEQYIREIAATGADTICITVFGYQENASSTSIFIDARKTPSQRRLRELLEYCRRDDPKTGKHALKVVLMPIVLLENRRGEEWRGTIRPSNWADWWRRYTDFILYYAGIAQDTGVDVLMVGSELLSTEGQEDRWKRLIAQVREVYKGRLSYSANWDHYRAVRFWQYVDIIGMTTYHDLVGNEKPTPDVLRASWRRLKGAILPWRNENHPHHPILFTEVGWPNQVTCAKDPWNYYAARKQPAPEIQADCFEAFFSTWMDEPAVAGYLVWEWRNHPSQPVGREDTSYVPCGKPAQKVIEKHYRSASEKKQAATRPAESTISTTPVGATD